MTAYLWDGPEDSDEEIKEMVQYKNQFEIEQGIKFSKNGIKKYVEELLAFESSTNTTDPANAKKWENKLDTKELKFSLKKGGSKYNESQPFLQTQSHFNSKFKMEKLVNCIYNPEHQGQWDKNLRNVEFKAVVPGKKTFGLNYNSNKKQFQFCSRDFQEKGFNFYSDGKFYRYSTSIDDSEAIKPIDDPKDMVRGFTIYNCGVMQRDETGQLVLRIITQCDFKITVPSFMLSSFLPKATKTWYDSVVKYYNKNHREL